MPTPLYDGYAFPNLPCKTPNAHKGLWFERFFDKYELNWSISENAKKNWITSLGNNCGNKMQLEAYAVNQSQLCESLQGKSQLFKNDWYFVTGMGIDHPVENGMSWHPTLGVPYLSGASVKGMIRTWVEEWSGLGEKQIEEKCLKWFGSRSKKAEEQQDENKAGDFIFFDAIPVTPVLLTCDIMTPHMGKWYSDGAYIQKKTQNEKGNYADTLPADWHNPIPIPFLVVKKTSLQFCIAPRTEEAQAELMEVITALKEALEYLGAGAKTAVGYGRFTHDQEEQQRLEKLIKQKQRAELSPENAFRSELTDIKDKKLAEMFGKDFNKTKKSYESNKCEWDDVLNILMESKKALIQSWAEHGANTAEGKAYKKLKSYL